MADRYKITRYEQDGKVEYEFPGHHPAFTIALLILSFIIGIFVLFIGLKYMHKADVVFKGGYPFKLIYSIILLLFLSVTLRAVLWNIFNREVIVFGDGMLSIDRQGTLFKNVKSYPVSGIRNLRVRETKASDRSGVEGGRFDPGSSLRFDADGQTIAFGSGISESTAANLIREWLQEEWISRENLLPAKDAHLYDFA